MERIVRCKGCGTENWHTIPRCRSCDEPVAGDPPAPFEADEGDDPPASVSVPGAIVAGAVALPLVHILVSACFWFRSRDPFRPVPAGGPDLVSEVAIPFAVLSILWFAGAVLVARKAASGSATEGALATILALGVTLLDSFAGFGGRPPGDHAWTALLLLVVGLAGIAGSVTGARLGARRV